MESICAWCRKSLGTVVVEGEKAGLISHGMCEACAESAFGELGISLQRFLDGLEQPVLVVDGEARVWMANRAAAKLARRADRVASESFGEVFECARSTRNGCGRSIHCSGCTIRDSIRKTYSSGEPCFARPASLKPRSGDRDGPVELTVSTEKAGDVVVLRIDDFRRGK